MQKNIKKQEQNVASPYQIVYACIYSNREALDGIFCRLPNDVYCLPERDKLLYYIDVLEQKLGLDEKLIDAKNMLLFNEQGCTCKKCATAIS